MYNIHKAFGHAEMKSTPESDSISTFRPHGGESQTSEASPSLARANFPDISGFVELPDGKAWMVQHASAWGHLRNEMAC